MRPLFLVCSTLVVIGLAGCLATGTQEQYAEAPRGSRSMYPLSTQTGAPAATPAEVTAAADYPQPVFGGVSTGGAYCEVEDTSQASPIVPMVDPPVMVDSVVYSSDSRGVVQPVVQPAPQVVYTPPAAPFVDREPAPLRADGRPMTFAERRMARGSPYDPILRGTPYPANSAAPIYSTQPTYPAQPVQTYTPAPQPIVTSTVTAPAPIYTTAPTQTYVPTVPVQQPVYGQVVTTPGTTTVIRGGTVMLPDPPMVIRDASGRVETVGMSTSPTVPLVRVPSQYAPGASTTAVPAAPPITPVIQTMPVQTTVTTPGPSAPIYVPGTATYAASELRLVPAPDVPPGDHPNDVAPSQWYEIIRPDNGPIRIGRVSSTCVCVGVRVPNRFVAAGERALIEARTLSRPSVNGLTYGIYVAVLEPVSATLDADIVVSARR